MARKTHKNSLDMKQLEIDFNQVAVLPPSVTSVEQSCVTVGDIEKGIYTPSVHGDFVNAEDDYLDDFDEACDLANDLDNNFEADIIDDNNRKSVMEVKDEKNSDSE